MIRTVTVGSDDRTEIRGTGRTWRLIEQAPPNAVFVAPNRSVEDEAAEMRSMMGRSDVRVVGVHWLESGNWRGTAIPIVLDHTIQVCVEDRHILDAHNARAADQT